MINKILLNLLLFVSVVGTTSSAMQPTRPLIERSGSLRPGTRFPQIVPAQAEQLMEITGERINPLQRRSGFRRIPTQVYLPEINRTNRREEPSAETIAIINRMKKLQLKNLEEDQAESLVLSRALNNPTETQINQALQNECLEELTIEGIVSNTLIIQHPSLKKINIVRCQDLKEIQLFTPNITHVDFSGCNQLSIINCPKKQSPNLIAITINGCTNLLIKELKKLLKQNPIEEISLIGCTQFIYDDIAEILSYCTLDATINITNIDPNVHQGMVTNMRRNTRNIIGL